MLAVIIRTRRASGLRYMCRVVTMATRAIKPKCNTADVLLANVLLFVGRISDNAVDLLI